MRRFLSGNEAVAEGVRLSKPNVISAYPITPQTTVVEKLSEIVEQKQLDSRFVHVESCLLYTSPSPRDGLLSRMPSSA